MTDFKIPIDDITTIQLASANSQNLLSEITILTDTKVIQIGNSIFPAKSSFDLQKGERLVGVVAYNNGIDGKLLDF